MLDLYVCLRPVQYFDGVPSPVKHPEKVDMVIFRENTEDIYAGIEYAAGTPEATKFLNFLEQTDPKNFAKIRFGTAAATTAFAKASMPTDPGEQKVEVGIGIKPVSKLGTQRLVYAAIEYAIKHKPQERDDRPQGEHHEVHRGGVPRLGVRAGQGRVRRRRDRRRAVVQDPRR